MLVKVAPRSILSSEKWHPAIQQNAGKSQIRSIQQNARKKWHPDLFYQAKCQSRSIQQNASKSGTQIHSIQQNAGKSGKVRAVLSSKMQVEVVPRSILSRKMLGKVAPRSVLSSKMSEPFYPSKSGTQIHSIQQNAGKSSTRPDLAKCW